LAEFRVLGTFQVISNGASLQLGPPKQRALLAILLLSVNQIVSTDLLIDPIWGGRSPRSAARSVQIYVSELRRILSEFRMPGSFDVPGADGVVDVRVDAHRFGGGMGGSWHRARPRGSGCG
jgi:DNA-binding SARP family transcriptional activator